MIINKKKTPAYIYYLFMFVIVILKWDLFTVIIGPVVMDYLLIWLYFDTECTWMIKTIPLHINVYM